MTITKMNSKLRIIINPTCGGLVTLDCAACCGFNSHPGRFSDFVCDPQRIFSYYEEISTNGAIISKNSVNYDNWISNIFSTIFIIHLHFIAPFYEINHRYLFTNVKHLLPLELSTKWTSMGRRRSFSASKGDRKKGLSRFFKTLYFLLYIIYFGKYVANLMIELNSIIKEDY